MAILLGTHAAFLGAITYNLLLMLSYLLLPALVGVIATRRAVALGLLANVVGFTVNAAIYYSNYRHDRFNPDTKFHNWLKNDASFEVGSLVVGSLISLIGLLVVYKIRGKTNPA